MTATVSPRAGLAARNGISSQDRTTFNLDLRAEKSFRVGSGMDASLLVEGFNVTNAKNPRLIDAAYVSGAPSATFGNVLVPLPGRELQLGARLKF